MKTTTQAVTCNRMVHLYSDAWEGPRPGVVITPGLSGSPVADVNVMLHGVKDADLLAEARKGSAGNTLQSVPIFDREEGDVATGDLVAGFGAECMIGGAGGAAAKVLAVWPARI